jgi:hypothetical protein
MLLSQPRLMSLAGRAAPTRRNVPAARRLVGILQGDLIPNLDVRLDPTGAVPGVGAEIDLNTSLVRLAEIAGPEVAHRERAAGND